MLENNLENGPTVQASLEAQKHVKATGENEDNDDVFVKFRKTFNVSLPPYLENLLRFTGFDNILSLATLDNSDISEIEEIARTQINSLFPQNTEHYLGCFKVDASKFCILPGQKKILVRIKEFCEEQNTKSSIFKKTSQKTYSDKGTQTTLIKRQSIVPKKIEKSAISKAISEAISCSLAPRSSNENGSRSKSSSTSSSNYPNENVFDENESGVNQGGNTNNERLEKNVQEELLDKAIRWTREFLLRSIKDDDDADATINTLINNVNSITAEVLPGSNTSIIKCFICSFKTKIFRTTSGCWLLSNYHRHFKTHLAEITKKKKKQSSQSSILSFLRENGNFSNNSYLKSQNHDFTRKTRKKPTLYENRNAMVENSILDSNTCVDQNVEPNSQIQILENIVVRPAVESVLEITNNSFSSPSFLPQSFSQIEPQPAQPLQNSVSQMESNLCELPPDLSTPSATESYTCEISTHPSTHPISYYELTSGDEETASNFQSGRVTTTTENIDIPSNTCLMPNDSQVLPFSSKSNKWRNPVYSRQQRNLRKLRIASADSYNITDFFPLVEKVQKEFSCFVSENNDFKKTLTSLNIDVSNDTNISTFFEALINNKTKHCEYRGRKYETNFKDFCTWLYLTGGKLMYETLHLNLRNIMPSPSTIRKRVVDNQTIEEGLFRFSALKAYLTDHKYPLNIWLSEDQTAINSKIQYSPKNNQLVGFTPPLDESGFPVLNNFPFDSLKQMEQYFENESKSNYINIIICQPLVDKASGFCLCVYGTNNKFSSEDVEKRWNKIEELAQEQGIRIEGFSTDGDCRMLKVMKTRSGLPTFSDSDWFFANFDAQRPLYIQDTIHIGTKLKTVFLKPSVELRIGKYEVSREHLKNLIDTVSKDKHSLTHSTLNPTDKMNFDSFDKMTQEKVVEALKNNMPNSKGTIAFLRISRFILDAFLSKELTPIQRIFKMWVSALFFRIWRYIVSNDNDASFAKNFITLNCYTCIEINAHALVQYVRRCRDSPINKFFPWLLSSQPCEKKFRELRSLTSTFSTVVNFSLFEVLHRLTRTELIGKISQDTEGYKFARESKKLGYNTNKSAEESLPTEAEIGRIIGEAVEYVKLLFLDMEIEVDNVIYYRPILKLNKDLNLDEDPESDEENPQENVLQDQTLEDNNIINDSDLDDVEDVNLIKDMFSSQGTLNLKDYTHPSKDITSQTSTQPSSFLKVTLNTGKTMTVKKSSLCWLFQSSYSKLSSDRLLRFKGNSKSQETEKVREKSIRKNPGKRIANKKRILRNTKKPRRNGESSSEESTDMSLHDNSSDDSEIFSDEDKRSEKEKNEKQNNVLIEIEKYYAVYYDIGWFLGRVISQNEGQDENVTILIKFLKQDLERYVWPKEKDIQIVEKKFVFYGPIDLCGNDPFTLKRIDKNNIEKMYKHMKK